MGTRSENENPILGASAWSRFFHRYVLLSILFFKNDPSHHSWIAQLLTKSHQQGTLHLTDLYDLLPEFESAKLTDKLEANWFDEIKRSPEKPSLVRATLHTIGWKTLFIGSLLFLSVSRLWFTVTSKAGV